MGFSELYKCDNMNITAGGTYGGNEKNCIQNITWMASMEVIIWKMEGVNVAIILKSIIEN
jgi:hypothetical protein